MRCRAFSSPAEARQADFAAMIKSGSWPEFDPRQTVLLDRSVKPAASASPDQRSVRIVSYRNTEIIVEAKSTTGGYVVLNDSWDDWWRVEIDGKPGQLERRQRRFPRG